MILSILNLFHIPYYIETIKCLANINKVILARHLVVRYIINTVKRFYILYQMLLYLKSLTIIIKTVKCLDTINKVKLASHLNTVKGLGNINKIKFIKRLLNRLYSHRQYLVFCGSV